MTGSTSPPFSSVWFMVMILSCLFVLCLYVSMMGVSGQGTTFIPHQDNSPPVYNFQTYLPNRVWINGTYIFVGPQYVTPNIIWGLGVGFFLLIILYVGISCIMGIQRPQRMTTVPLVLAKEY